MAEDREALKAKLEKELAELRKEAGDDADEAKQAVEEVKADAKDEVKALEKEVRKHKVERASKPAANPSREQRSEPDTRPVTEDPTTLEGGTGLRHSAGSHGPEHDKLPGPEGDTRVLNPGKNPVKPGDNDLRDLSVAEQAKRRGL